MSIAHDHARNGNINALQQEIQRNPNVVNEKNKVRTLFYNNFLSYYSYYIEWVNTSTLCS